VNAAGGYRSGCLGRAGTGACALSVASSRGAYSTPRAGTSPETSTYMVPNMTAGFAHVLRCPTQHSPSCGSHVRTAPGVAADLPPSPPYMYMCTWQDCDKSSDTSLRERHVNLGCCTFDCGEGNNGTGSGEGLRLHMVKLCLLLLGMALLCRMARAAAGDAP
jgi:hypothetical protein